jgi:hypothetical protein
MPRAYDTKVREYNSGEEVEPGIYVDTETGAVVEMRERDELPEGVRIVHYRRRFRRVAAFAEATAR